MLEAADEWLREYNHDEGSEWVDLEGGDKYCG